MFSMTPKYAAPVKTPDDAPIRTTIVFHGLTPGLESLLQSHPHTASVEAYQLALESEQLDHSAQLAAELEVQDTLNKYASDHPHSGPMHVYLLGDPSAPSYDRENETTPMKALVNAALRNKSKIVAALLPEDETVSKVADIPNTLSLRQLADTVLAQESVPVIVGKAAFEAFLKDPDSVVKPSMEGFGAAAGIAAIAAAIGGLFYLGKVNSRNNAERRDRIARIKNAVHAMRDLITHTYTNAGWLNDAQFVTGAIHSDDIVMYTTVGNRTVPANRIGAAAVTYGHALKQFASDYEKAALEYIDKLIAAIHVVSNKHSGTKSAGAMRIEITGILKASFDSGDEGAPEEQLLMKLHSLKPPLEVARFPHEVALSTLQWTDLEHSRRAKNWQNDENTTNISLQAMTREDLLHAANGEETLLAVFDALMAAAERIAVASDRLDKNHEAFKQIHAKYTEVHSVDEEDGSITRYHELDNEHIWDEIELFLYNAVGQVESSTDSPLYHLGMYTARTVEAIGKWMERSIHGAPSHESLTTIEDLSSLRRLDRLGRVNPSLESPEGVFAGVVLGSLAAVNIGLYVQSALKSWKHDRSLKRLPDSEKRSLEDSEKVRDAIVQLKRSYGNPAWYDKQAFVDGPISGKGIRDRLLVGTALPANPAAAVTQHMAAVHENFGKVIKAVDGYAKRVNPIAVEMIKKYNAGETKEVVVDWAESQLKTVPDPLHGVAFNLKGMLGNPVVEHEYDEWSVDFPWHRHKFGSTAEPESQIPALTMDQAKAVGVVLIKLLDTVVDYMTNWSYNDQPLDNYRLSDMVGQSPEAVKRWDELWEEMIDALHVAEHYWPQDHGRKYDDVRYFLIDSLPEVAMALERWIHRSISKPKA